MVDSFQERTKAIDGLIKMLGIKSPRIRASLRAMTVEQIDTWARAFEASVQRASKERRPSKVRLLTPQLLAETSRNYTAEANNLPRFNEMPRSSQVEWLEFAEAILKRLGPVSTIPEETT
jgi:hypothetical protein